MSRLYIDNEDVPSSIGIITLHGCFSLLKLFRLQSKETGFAAGGEVNFLDLLEEIQDHAGVLTEHYGHISCQAPACISLVWELVCSD